MADACAKNLIMTLRRLSAAALLLHTILMSLVSSAPKNVPDAIITQQSK